MDQIQGTKPDVCKTFGSGVIHTFNDDLFYLKSNCIFIFIKKGTDFQIKMQGEMQEMLNTVTITINQIEIQLENGEILVEGDKLNWIRASVGRQMVFVACMAGMECNSTISSYFMSCLNGGPLSKYLKACRQNVCNSKNASQSACDFYEELANQCPDESLKKSWRNKTNCDEVTCPGNLVFKELGNAFMETCSNPTLPLNVPQTKTCVCQDTNDAPKRPSLFPSPAAPFGFCCLPTLLQPCMVLSHPHCMPAITHGPRAGPIASSPRALIHLVLARSTLATLNRTCKQGHWNCTKYSCPSRCTIEGGQFVTTFDGKRYMLPGRCGYVAVQGPDWKITINSCPKKSSLDHVTIVIHDSTIRVTSCTNAAIFWGGLKTDTIGHRPNVKGLAEKVNIFQQSSMYMQMETAFGLLVQIQMTPAVQLYVTLPVEEKGTTKGLCGNYNDDITDEFISSSGIPEYLAENFAKSWLTGPFHDKIPSICTNTDYEMYGKESCEILRDLNGPFAKCHEYVRFDRYVKMCEQSTCKCLGNVKDCLCAALGNYAKACAAEGIMVGDWRKDECPVICPKNQEFDYNMRACNRTCRSLSDHDITCDANDVPVDGCGCAEGTHMNSQFSCVSKAQCPCYYNGGEVSPGPAVINGQSW
ncbi:mucin-2-like [Amia ocellicauda]|uniref:mucin-2-like n=1 Tax=Amia ocellicauda TaxID=2972642 RepID=UPI003463AC39